ncbi:MAG: DUF2497 domain-containing protein, partial [Beijerinckiaceae bacterium]|nr:DUF2497 domain-containing protein [Beijerinckiaceae bacterium]
PTPEPAAAKPVATMSAMTTEAPPAPAPRRAAGSALYPMPSIPDDPGPEPADAGAGAGQRRFFP